MSKRCTAGTRSTLSMKQLTGKKMTYLEESRMLRKKYYLYLDNQEYSSSNLQASDVRDDLINDGLFKTVKALRF